MKNYFPVVAARRAASASLICAICVICGLSSALEISNSTNTPTTNSAAIYATLTNVIVATTATCYYGTTDGGTSAAAWAYSTNYADCTNGEITVTVTNLVPATWYFYRWYAADGGTNTNSTAWASTSSNLVTLSRAPTNYPTPGAGVTVVADPTTGLILAPTNLVMPTAPDISNRLTAAEGAITTNAQAIGSISTRVDNAEGAISTNAGNIATNADNFTAHTNNETADIQHLTAAEKAIATNQSPYQAFSATVEAVDGTATVVYASGSLVRIYCTNDTTLAFDSTDYPTSGVSRVAVELWADTNSIAFDSTTINTNDFAPTISSNDWTSLFFRRSGTNLWTGRY